jgi:GDP-L-fucose synthase
MDKTSKILVLGSRGMVGSAIIRELQKMDYCNILQPSRNELNLMDGIAVGKYFELHKPEYIFLAAAKVGGIIANSLYQVEFGRENIIIQTNVLDSAASGCERGYVKKLLFLGSSCIYPRDCPQPIKEEYLLSGQLEDTNYMYALSKIHGLKMCQSYKRQYGYNFISCMPTNLYGINDNFDEKTSHVLPGIMSKIYKSMLNEQDAVLFGDGSALREFLYVDDMAEACIILMNNYDGESTINVGYGEDMSIKDVARYVSEVMDYRGNIVWDTTKPNGTMRKLLDSTKIKQIGWSPRTKFKDGLYKTYMWFLEGKNGNK